MNRQDILENYENKIQEQAQFTAWELVPVILNSDFPVAANPQYSKKAPAYVSDPEEVAKVAGRSRAQNSDYQRLQEFALLYPNPQAKSGQHWQAVNPDIRRVLKEAAALNEVLLDPDQEKIPPMDPAIMRLSRVIGKISEVTAEDFPSEVVGLSPELENLKGLKQRSTEIATATMWYVGRAIDQGEVLPYEYAQQEKDGYGDVSYFSLRAFIFGHLAPYYQREAWPEIDIMFEQPPGINEEKKGYIINGRLTAPEDKLKSPKSFEDREIPLDETDGYRKIKNVTDVKKALKDHAERILTTILRYGMFEPDEVTSDPGKAVDVGAGQYDLKLAYGDPDIDEFELTSNNLAHFIDLNNIPREIKEDLEEGKEMGYFCIARYLDLSDIAVHKNGADRVDLKLTLRIAQD